MAWVRGELLVLAGHASWHAERLMKDSSESGSCSRSGNENSPLTLRVHDINGHVIGVAAVDEQLAIL